MAEKDAVLVLHDILQVLAECNHQKVCCLGCPLCRQMWRRSVDSGGAFS